MTNKEKSRKIMETFTEIYGVNIERDSHIYSACMQMAQWKDEQLKHTRNEARDLYNEISACIGNLVKGRLDKNGIRVSNALAQMESLMVKTEQFLLTI